MLRADQINAAVEGIVAAAVLGEGWEDALGHFARAAGARDAVLMRNAANRMVTALATEEAAAAVAQFAAGQAPPNSRYRRVKTRPGQGFRVDHDDYGVDELARDPFYQDFLRAHGVFWHANVMIGLGRDEHVEISLKRSAKLAPYQRDDVAALDRVLPQLRAAVRIAKATLDAEARGIKWVLSRRGGPLLEFDAQGRLLPGQDVEADFSPLRIVGRRLASVDPDAQSALDMAVMAALPPDGRVALAALPGADGRRYILQVHPVPGMARDIFSSASAIGVVIEREAGSRAILSDPSALRQLFGLTDREADVAALLAEGLSLADIAMRLRIGAGTVRGYLKGVFEKTGTGRQAELVALVARLLP